MNFHLPLKDWADRRTLLQSAAYMREAARVLEAEGWIQSAYRSEHGYCAAGAITEAVRRRGASITFLPASTPASMAQAVHWRIYGEDITGFNDAPERTRSEVIERLRVMAELTEAEVVKW